MFKQNNLISFTSLMLFLLMSFSLMAFSLIIDSTDAYAKSANITVTTSRNPVTLDDSFHLIYEADSSVDDDPDFTPIYDHFDILSSSQSTNMRSINGSWSMKKSWDLTVIAKDVGKFVIPPIAFGSDISPAIQVTVSNSSSPNSALPGTQATVPAKIFLETEIDKKTGWVQSQFIYTVRLIRTVSIANASLSEPVTSDADAIIEKLSEDNYQTKRNGVSYEVFERRYAIFPQKSGTLKIEPLTFEGRVNATQPRTIFDQFRMSGQLKRLRSKAVDFTVKAAPSDINLQDWLPASEVQLIEQWSDDIQNIRAGEPVTRTIIISAEGLTGVQLPDLNFAEIDGMKQYPDKPIIENRQADSGITGLKQVKVALIPGSAGSYTLPELSLPWWNTRTNKKELAILPQQTITVTGSAITPVTPALTAPAASPAAALTPDSSGSGQPMAPAQQPAASPAAADEYWKWLSGFFALAWLLTLLFYIKKPSTQAVAASTKPAANATANRQSIRTASEQVKKQVKNKNAINTKDALIKWARLYYADENISNLSHISAHCSTALADEIEALNQSLYSSAKTEWHSSALLLAFTDESSSRSKSGAKASALKPLYQG